MQDLQYYQKYYKYKQKYLNLIQHGGEPTYDDMNTNIYLKFITEKLVALLPSEITVLVGGAKRKNEVPIEELSRSIPEIKVSRRSSRIRNQPLRLQDYVQDLTPQILRYLSPLSKIRMEEDIEIDNEVIKKLNEIQEEKDSEYVSYENYGKLIEVWIANNMRCPSCGADNSLRRYVSDFMPIIDLVCINPTHTLDNGVKFFQVKTSNGAPFDDKPYFNYDFRIVPNPNANTIHVGSRRWGNPVHNITPLDSPFYKKILCGYICIRFIESDSALSIDLANSMIVLPKYLKSAEPIKRQLLFEVPDEVPMPPVLLEDDNTWYYRYVDLEAVKHNRIRFNLATNVVLLGDEINALLPELTIDKSYPINTDVMLNPLRVIESI